MTQTPGTIPQTEELNAEITRLRARLAAARLESANRLAAIRAALGAAREGEPDPLAYLRDQIAEETTAAGLASGL